MFWWSMMAPLMVQETLSVRHNKPMKAASIYSNVRANSDWELLTSLGSSGGSMPVTDYLFEMDADFSHNPNDLERLREACMDGAGVAVGSRYTKGGAVSNWPWHRIAMSYGASLYVNTVLQLGVKDPTAGFKCYRAETLKAIRLDHIHFIGYAFQIEMKYNAKRLGFSIAEVPITFVDRVLGSSKMSLNIFKEAFVGVLQMRGFDIRPADASDPS